jgi:hypothetical protein
VSEVRECAVHATKVVGGGNSAGEGVSAEVVGKVSLLGERCAGVEIKPYMDERASELAVALRQLGKNDYRRDDSCREADPFHRKHACVLGLFLCKAAVGGHHVDVKARLDSPFLARSGQAEGFHLALGIYPKGKRARIETILKRFLTRNAVRLRGRVERCSGMLHQRVYTYFNRIAGKSVLVLLHGRNQSLELTEYVLLKFVLKRKVSC